MSKIAIIFCSLFLSTICDDFNVTYFQELLPQSDGTINNIVFENLGTYTGAYDNGTFYQKTFLLSRHAAASWGGQRTICQSFNYELATFESFLESLWFLTTADNNSFLRTFSTFYIGIDGMTTEPRTTTEWYWANTVKKISYPLTWRAGQPNSNNDQFCLRIEKEPGSVKFTYNDYTCSTFNSFVCQKWNKI